MASRKSTETPPRNAKGRFMSREMASRPRRANGQFTKRPKTKEGR